MSKKKKYRGSGTCGGGSKKKRRGAGSRGGRGRGSAKNKKIKYRKEEGQKKKGFTRPQKLQKEVKTVNLKELSANLDELLEKGLAEKKNGKISIDISVMGYDKLLGEGQLSDAWEVKSKKFSKRAREKLEESGGKAIEIS